MNYFAMYATYAQKWPRATRPSRVYSGPPFSMFRDTHSRSPQTAPQSSPQSSPKQHVSIPCASPLVPALRDVVSRTKRRRSADVVCHRGKRLNPLPPHGRGSPTLARQFATQSWIFQAVARRCLHAANSCTCVYDILSSRTRSEMTQAKNPYDRINRSPSPPRNPPNNNPAGHPIRRTNANPVTSARHDCSHSSGWRGILPDDPFSDHFLTQFFSEQFSKRLQLPPLSRGQ